MRRFFSSIFLMLLMGGCSKPPTVGKDFVRKMLASDITACNNVIPNEQAQCVHDMKTAPSRNVFPMFDTLKVEYAGEGSRPETYQFEASVKANKLGRDQGARGGDACICIELEFQYGLVIYSTSNHVEIGPCINQNTSLTRFGE